MVRAIRSTSTLCNCWLWRSGCVLVGLYIPLARRGGPVTKRWWATVSCRAQGVAVMAVRKTLTGTIVRVMTVCGYFRGLISKGHRASVVGPIIGHLHMTSGFSIWIGVDGLCRGIEWGIHDLAWSGHRGEGAEFSRRVRVGAEKRGTTS